MKVSQQVPTNISKTKSAIEPKAKKQTAEEVKAKIREKFGKETLVKEVKKPIEDKAELNSKPKIEGVSGDDIDNDPKSTLTHDKIKQVLKSGAFKFSDRERATLAKILK